MFGIQLCFINSLYARISIVLKVDTQVKGKINISFSSSELLPLAQLAFRLASCVIFKIVITSHGHYL